MNDAMDDILGPAVPQVRELADRVRRYVLTTLPPGVVEVPRPKEQVMAFGASQFKTEKGEPELFAWLGAFPDKVTLGFYRGADLPDPHGLLKGDGPGRRTDITDARELENPAMKELLEAAYRKLIEGQ
jgi:hypothetical protein